jgi:hypothetical protein
MLLNKLCDFIFIANGQSQRYYKLFFIGLSAAIVVRLGMFWLVDYRFDVGDGRYYLDVANNIVNHHTVSGDVNYNPIPSMYRPPLYSFFVAGITCIFGENPLYIQLVQLILSIGTIVFVTRITAFYSRNATPYVFALMVMSPFEAVYSVAILSEVLVAFLLTFSVCVLLTFKGRNRLVICGLALGLTALVRDIYLPLIIIFSVWVAFDASFNRQRFSSALILFLFACIAIAPWTIRNYNISQRFVPVSDGRLGLSLWIGTWAVDGKFTANDAMGLPRVYPPEAFRSEFEKGFVQSALEKGGKSGDQELKSFALDRLYHNPFEVFKVYFVRAPLLWLGTRFDIFQLNKDYFSRGSIPYVLVKASLWGLNFLLISFAFLGMFLAWRLDNKIKVLAIPVLYTAIIYFPLNSFENRYSQPVYPFLLVFVGFGISILRNKYNLMRLKSI